MLINLFYFSSFYDSQFFFSANRVLSYMNTTADPCEDFYEFACGGWVTQHPVNSKIEYISVYSIIQHETSKIVKSE